MFFQLGTRMYDGTKSFVSFGEQSEATVVEYALLGRKPRLQGTANTLNQITISFLFHQQFCKVKEEIAALKKSQDSFEILPMVSGTGEILGDYVITQMSTEHTQMDNLGNTIIANVSITLKESVKDNTQQAPPQTLATGNKQPTAKSNRTNPSPCNSRVANYVQQINSMNVQIQQFVLKYTGQANAKAAQSCNIMDGYISQFSEKIGSFSCIPIANQKQAILYLQRMHGSLSVLYAEFITFQGASGIYTIKNNAAELNTCVQGLKSSCAGNIKKSIVSK